MSTFSKKDIINYFDKFNPHKLTIDIFNCWTLYRYEDELNQPIQKPIHKFIDGLQKKYIFTRKNIRKLYIFASI